MSIKTAIKSVIPNSILELIREKPDIEKLLEEIEHRGVKLSELDALEVFGRDGWWHTQFYANRIKSLEVWEIQEKYALPLKENLPNARIRIVDSYSEIKRTKNKFGLVVVDNSMGIFVDDPYDGEPPTTYCEHFDLFPDIFRVLNDRSIIIVNVIPQVTSGALKKYPQLFCPEQLLRRSSFYGTEHPESVLIPEMEKAYTRIAGMNGFHAEWMLSTRRGDGVVYYLAMGLRKISE